MIPKLKTISKYYEEYYCRKLKCTIDRYLAENNDCELWIPKED